MKCPFDFSTASGDGNEYGLVVGLTNNLFDRCKVSAVRSYMTDEPVFVVNNLFHGGSFLINYTVLTGDMTNVWYVEDNLFENATTGLSGGSGGSWPDYVYHDHNAYVGSTELPQPQGGDVFPGAADYQTGPLGRYYYPVTGTNLSSLTNAGSVNASVRGLYEYTTTINLVKESNSVVDIGFHYLATDTNGIPDSTLWFGIPDYLLDTNQDGDAALVTWQMNYFGHTGLDPSSDPDGDGNTLLYDYQNGIDPNQNMSFTMRLGNGYFNTTNATGSFVVLNAVPAYEAVLVNSTNFSSAVWTNYDGIIHLPLGPTDGVYQVWAALKGHASGAAPQWVGTTVHLDRVAPTVTITNPASTNTLVPLVQLQGYASEPLQGITYDLSNALAVVTNQPGSLTGRFLDTNTMTQTTNYFQCYDIFLTNGLNTITVHATDLAGNTTTTNVSVTVNYSSATNPVAQIYWPSTNTAVVGTSFTCRGMVDDPTATINAEIVDTNSVTNWTQGVVERDGKFWVENLPLTAGSNWLTLTFTNSAGLSSVTNLVVMGSTLNLAITSVTGDYWKPTMTVNGTFDDFSDYTVWVNGVKATDNGGGTWTASLVPVQSGGVAVFQARAVPNSDNGGNGTGGSGGGAVSYSDPGNPSAPTLNDFQLETNKPAEIVEASGRYSYEVYSLDADPSQYSDPGPFDWADGQDLWNSTEGDGGFWLGIDSTMNTTDKFLAPIQDDGSVPVAHWTHISFGVTNTDDVSEPTFDDLTSTWVAAWGQEQGALSVYGQYYTKDWSKKSVTSDVVLYTGGKAIPGRQSLFALTVSAEEEVAGTPLDGYDALIEWGGPDIPPASITVDGQTLGADNIAWKAYPDCTSQDVTPQTGASMYHYSITQQKYTPTISGLDPDTVLPGAQFCVGQILMFALDGLPDGATQTCNDWSFDGDYFNAASNDVPGTTFPTCSLDPYVNADLLTNATTSAWWVSGGLPPAVYTASYDGTVLLANGQSVNIGATGKFGMTRPQAKISPITSSVNVATNFLKFSGLGINGIKFFYTIDVPTNFLGSVDWVQVITSSTCYVKETNGTQHTQIYGTPPNYLDTTNPYPSFEGTNAVDNPGNLCPAGTKYGLLVSSATFTMVMMFTPSGGTNVPLRFVKWSWYGSATNDGAGNWSLKFGTNTVNPPDSEVEAYPIWESNITNCYWDLAL